MMIRVEGFPCTGAVRTERLWNATYKNVGYAWATQFDPNPPYISNSTTIRVLIVVPSNFLRTGRARDVYFHVGSATSNLTLWVNASMWDIVETARWLPSLTSPKYLKPGKNPDSYAGDALVRWFLFRGSGLLALYWYSP